MRQFLTMKTILFDLDDTLIDTNYRQFSVIKHSIINLGESFNLDYSYYLEFRKRQKVSNSDFVIAHYPLIEIEEFQKAFSANIEHENFLNLDTLLVDSSLLLNISTKYKISLLSLRQNRENGIKQLKSLGIKNIFENIYFIKHQDKYVKASFIENSKLKFDYYIGDSEIDKIAAKSNNILFFGVNSNIHNQEKGLSINEILVKLL